MTPEAMPSPSVRVDDLVEIGSLFAGRYVIERHLGRGGMGFVVLAYEPDRDERVALKVLNPEVAKSPQAVERFEREARAMAKLPTDHVAKVLGLGRSETGVPFMCMEFLEGESLGEYLARHGPLPLPMAVGFVLQACEALGHAHAAGIVHRDVKPSNFFLVPRDDGSLALKVLDFGIAKEVEGKRVTHTSEVFGSPEYMSPEQVRATKDVDARSDIWALGVCLYELASGRLPFEGTSVFEAGSKILFERHRALSAMVPDVPAELSSIVDQCLEKRPERRYASTRELAEALESCGTGRALARQNAEAELLAASNANPTELAMSLQDSSVRASAGVAGAPSRTGDREPGARPRSVAVAARPSSFGQRSVGHAAFVMLALSGVALLASLWRAMSHGEQDTDPSHAVGSSETR